MSLFRTKITVNAHERAAEYVDGSLTRVLAPGRYRQPRRATYVRVHVLESIQQLAAQDVLSSDGVSVRVTVVLRVAVSDVERYLAVTPDPHGVVYLAVQVALRDALVDVPVEEARALGPARPRVDAVRGGPPRRRAGRPGRASRSWSRT